MQLSLPPIFKQFRYSQLGTDPTSSGDGTSTNRLYMNSIWSSKRLRVVIPLTVLLLLLAIGVYFHDNIALPALPDYPSLSHGTPGTGSKDLVSTNADILNAVAPSIDWSRFAYVQYVTNLPYLCNSVMLFEILERLGCRSERLMMYPQGWSPDTKEGNQESTESRLLRIARDKYKVHLQPIHVQSRASSDRKLLDLKRLLDSNTFSSNMGGELHQTLSNEPNPVRPSPQSRLGLHSPPMPRRTIPPSLCPRRHATRLLAMEK